MIKIKQVLIISFLLSSVHGYSQNIFLKWFDRPFKNGDTSFIKSDPDLWSIRLNTTYKFNNYKIADPVSDSQSFFQGKTSIGFGAGFSFRNFNVDVAVKTHPYHTTHNFIVNGLKTDMVFSMYNHQHLLDGEAQFYDGYQEKQVQTLTLIDDSVQAHVRNFGLHYDYLLNSKKISMTAAMMGTEIQLRSAGSLMCGGEVNYFHEFTKTDVTYPLIFAPPNLNIAQLGLSIGYAYTFVIKHHLFLMVNPTPSVTFVTGFGQPVQVEKGISFSLLNREAIGINLNHVYVIASSVLTVQRSVVGLYSDEFYRDFGKQKVVIGYRFF